MKTPAHQVLFILFNPSNLKAYNSKYRVYKRLCLQQNKPALSFYNWGNWILKSALKEQLWELVPFGKKAKVQRIP